MTGRVGLTQVTTERLELDALLVSVANRKLSTLTPSVIVPASVLRRSVLIAVLGLLILGVVTWRAIPPMVAAAESAWLMW